MPSVLTPYTTLGVVLMPSVLTPYTILGQCGLNAISADSIHHIGCGLNAVSADPIHHVGCGLNAVRTDSIHHIGCSLNDICAVYFIRPIIHGNLLIVVISLRAFRKCINYNTDVEIVLLTIIAVSALTDVLPNSAHKGRTG